MSSLTAIVPAAGNSSRVADSSIPSKIFFEISGATVIQHALRRLEQSGVVSNIIIPTQKAFEETLEQQISALNLSCSHKIIEGGKTRQESVYAALKSPECKGEYCLVHDAARPNVDIEKVREVVLVAQSCDGAILAVPASSTVKLSEDGKAIDKTLSRDSVYLANTPQVFNRQKLLSAHQEAESKGWEVTDDSQLMELVGGVVKLVVDIPSNIKLTNRDDLSVLSSLMLNN